MTIKTFAPNGQNTATIVASSVTARVALDPYSAAVRVQNKGPGEVFLQFGDINVAATVSHMPVASGSTETFSKANAAYVAAICAGADTATVRFTNGEGL